ncbi:MAG: hypothetical protein HKM88_02825 [Halobacteria archaeon]|nr:hypothetical protein [Halobacteria archaeon]
MRSETSKTATESTEEHGKKNSPQRRKGRGEEQDIHRKDAMGAKKEFMQKIRVIYAVA